MFYEEDNIRETYSSLQVACQNYCLNDNSATTLTFLKSEINRAQRFIYAELQDYLNQKTQTATYVSGQQYYHYPPDLMMPQMVTVTINSVIYTLTPIDSEDKWQNYNSMTYVTFAIPVFWFDRKRDFGIWPIPQDNTSTISLIYNYYPQDMTMADYSTGTITLTNNSTAVTGNGTAFTANMVGQWLNVTKANNGDGNWYLITAFNSATSLTIEEAYQGTTQSGLTYNLGESPDIPPEAHELIAYRATRMYFQSLKGDSKRAEEWDNMFWTGDPSNDSRDVRLGGGLLGLKARYSKRSISRVVHLAQYPTVADAFNLQLWSSKITSL